jgi:hypothetical protein
VYIENTATLKNFRILSVFYYTITINNWNYLVLLQSLNVVTFEMFLIILPCEFPFGLAAKTDYKKLVITLSPVM